MLYYLYKVGRRLTSTLPLRICYWMAIFFADIYDFFARDDRRNLEYNLRIVLGSEDRKLIRKYIKNVFRNFAKYLVDFLRFSRLRSDYLVNKITIEGREWVDKAISGGKGAILLSAHIGNWELGAAVAANMGYPFYAIALDHKDKRINDFFLNQRALANIKVIPISARLKSCFKVLRKNSLLAIVGDRDFSKTGVRANFFGRPTILPKGPAFFSLRTGAPIIPTFLIRTKDDSFRMIFEQPIEANPTTKTKRDIRNIIERYTRVIEKYIKRFPDQWYAYKKMWG